MNFFQIRMDTKQREEEINKLLKAWKQYNVAVGAILHQIKTMKEEANILLSTEMMVAGFARTFSLHNGENGRKIAEEAYGRRQEKIEELKNKIDCYEMALQRYIDEKFS